MSAPSTVPSSVRAGIFQRQPEGYDAFIPAALPPAPPVEVEIPLLADAALAVGRLDSVSTILPNPDLFVAMYVRQEAVYSSQIEGTQASLTDVLQAEAAGGSRRRPPPVDVAEVLNYIEAMNWGLGRLEEIPLCLRLIREIHERLMSGVRGEE